jgi:hypothetical protein
MLGTKVSLVLFNAYEIVLTILALRVAPNLTARRVKYLKLRFT